MTWTIEGDLWTFQKDSQVGRFIRRGNYFDYLSGHRFRPQEIWSALGWMGML